MVVPGLAFRFAFQTVSIQYAATDGLIDQIADNARSVGDGELIVVGRNPDDSLLLQSASGSTQLVAGPDQTLSHTAYYGNFAEEGAWDERGAYGLRKIEALLGLLSSASARLSFIGLTTVAQLSVRDLNGEALRRAAATAFGVLPLLTEGEPCFDFSLRASRAVEPDVFSNIYANWFQQRSAPMSMGPAQMSHRPFKPWQMHLDDEGVELRFDRNNKRGLYRGTTDWTAERFVAIARQAFADLPGSYGKLVEVLRKGYEEAGK